MTEFIEQEFSEFEVVESPEDGINESYYFDSGSKRYVGKLFSWDAIQIEDYLGTVEVARSHLTDGVHLHTPDIVASGTFDGCAYVIYEYISGVSLEFDELYEKGLVDEYISSVGRILAELHSLDNPIDDFGWFTMDEGNLVLKNGYNDSLGLSLSQLNHNLNNIGDYGFTEEFSEDIRRFLKENLDYNRNPVIGHCDVKWNNIIDSSGSLYLIDWEFVRSVDPLYDYVKAERGLVRRYDRLKKLSDDEVEKFCQVFRNSYTESSFISFNKERYLCYWLLEMVECLRNCSEWYSEEELGDVRAYYRSEVERVVRELE